MRRSIFVLLIIAAVLLLVIVAVPFLIDANQFRPRLEAMMSDVWASLPGRMFSVGGRAAEPHRDIASGLQGRSWKQTLTSLVRKCSSQALKKSACAVSTPPEDR